VSVTQHMRPDDACHESELVGTRKGLTNGAQLTWLFVPCEVIWSGMLLRGCGIWTAS
jgi:hypothetical protein